MIKNVFEFVREFIVPSFLGIASIVALVGLFVWLVVSTSSSDNTKNGGLEIYTDSETGCQYVAAPIGDTALTPRLGRDGKQICEVIK